MMKKIWIIGFLPFLLPLAVFGVTINDALVHVINTNPEVRERIENYRAVEQDKEIAFSGYLPVVDVQGGIGKKRYDSNIPELNTDNYTYTEAFIRARQNLFHGFGTQNDVEQQDKRLISAEFFLMEKVSQLGLDMIEKYLEILKSKKLFDLAVENHGIHKKYYSKIKERTNSGAGTNTDLEQILGRLALAESNVMVAENNLMDAETNFLRIYGYGEAISSSDLRETNINKSLIPKTFQEAEELAENQYPSVLTMQNNVEALEAGYRQTKENYYPWVDLELKQSYYDNNADTFTGSNLRDEVDQTTIMVVATWNLYNGGADDALKEKAAARMFEASDRMLNTKRLVSERLRLSWAAKERLSEQLKHLKKHRDYTKKTLDAYNEEFGLGKRTLLDLLDVENEYYTSKKAYVSAGYDQKLAEYRIVENVGNLPQIVSITSDDVLKLERNTK